MQYLRQSTAATVPMGPFVSPTTALAVNSLSSQSGRLVKAGTGSAFTPASWAQDGSAGGQYLVGLATGDVGTVGRLRVYFDAPATYLPVWEDFVVLSAAVYDVLFGTVALGTMANIWDEVNTTTTHNATNSTGRQLRTVSGGTAAATSLRTGTAQGGSTTTITLDAGASAVTDFYVPSIVSILSGTGTGQSATIGAYNGTTKVATLSGTDTWATPPDATSGFQIDPFGQVIVARNNDKTGYGLAATQAYNNTGQTSNLPADLQTIKTQAVTAASAVTVLASVGTAATGTAQTGDAFARIGVNGAGLTAIPYTGPSAGTIQAGLATSSALAALVTTVGAAGAGLTSVALAAAQVFNNTGQTSPIPSAPSGGRISS